MSAPCWWSCESSLVGGEDRTEECDADWPETEGSKLLSHQHSSYAFVALAPWHLAVMKDYFVLLSIFPFIPILVVTNRTSFVNLKRLGVSWHLLRIHPVSLRYHRQLQRIFVSQYQLSPSGLGARYIPATSHPHMSMRYLISIEHLE
jgi:hypothetical protein